MNVSRPNISLRTFLKTKVKYEFPENLRCSNINVNYWSVNCLTGAKKRPLAKMLWSVSIKTRTFASVNTCNGSF